MGTPNGYRALRTIRTVFSILIIGRWVGGREGEREREGGKYSRREDTPCRFTIGHWITTPSIPIRRPARLPIIPHQIHYSNHHHHHHHDSGSRQRPTWVQRVHPTPWYDSPIPGVLIVPISPTAAYTALCCRY
ncbi:hypothetical protein EX30DRAFT_254294 [Ascodesmis nigricans]|uniref:Uncharacterized protein n=1 Tax=Ascodesmis nigricans TaxID=341454 RepID=A0A4S2MYP2_9PEZI|nr:hypothetical protein EX30DRAFT_254294 [Ascodesmis nigricans]